VNVARMANGPNGGGVPTLDISGLALTYAGTNRTVDAIRSLSLSIAEGEFVSIVGPSGCGKSSLLKIIYGLIRPSAGTASIAGRPIDGPRPDLGMVFQSPVLLPWRTILENVLLPVDVQRLDRRKMSQHARDLISMVGLGGFENVYPDELSGGMQQRAGIVRALIHDPKLLLMDEPFAALDALTREQMALELQRIWLTSRKTVLFVTHSISEAVLLSDRVVLMSARPGRIVDVFELPKKRPRSFDDLAAPEFAEVAKAIRHGLNAASEAMH
jgi:NitT/TauT family transport system ATP-binding protein